MSNGWYRLEAFVVTTTAHELTRYGLDSWIEQRQDAVEVKGKGQMQTYWLVSTKITNNNNKKQDRMEQHPGENLLDTATLDIVEEFQDDEEEDDDNSSRQNVGNSVNLEQGLSKEQRLIEWNTEVLASLLQQILAARHPSQNHNDNAAGTKDNESQRRISIFHTWSNKKKSNPVTTGGESADQHGGNVPGIESMPTAMADLLSKLEAQSCQRSTTALDEFQPIIELPQPTIWEQQQQDAQPRPRSTALPQLSAAVKNQLRDLVTSIAHLYCNSNPFHNFEV